MPFSGLSFDFGHQDQDAHILPLLPSTKTKTPLGAHTHGYPPNIMPMEDIIRLIKSNQIKSNIIIYLYSNKHKHKPLLTILSTMKFLNS